MPEKVKLTEAQRDLLEFLAVTDVGAITDKRIANALGLKGFARYDAKTDTWSITEAGRAQLTEGK